MAIPAGSRAASYHHIPGWQEATQRAKLGIVAAAPLGIASLRPLRLMVGLALLANTGLWGAGVAADAGLEANSSGDIQKCQQRAAGSGAFRRTRELEGCVHQGFLPRLASMNWNQPVTIPAEAVRRVNLLRARIHILLWAGLNLPYLALPIFLGIAWWLWRRRERGSLEAKGGG